MEFAHRSVLLHECIDALAIKPDGIYLDGTLGGAGHSLEICRSLTTGRLIGVDRDLVALEAAKKRLYRHAKKVTLVHDNFENVGAILTALGLDRIDGMLFDLGVSSPQLDDAERGFSYMADAPLDMRMDRDQSLTAYEIVNNWPREELKSILYEYGEERCAPQIAAAIERVRTDHPIETTLELVDIIRSAMPPSAHTALFPQTARPSAARAQKPPRWGSSAMAAKSATVSPPASANARRSASTTAAAWLLRGNTRPPNSSRLSKPISRKNARTASGEKRASAPAANAPSPK